MLYPKTVLAYVRIHVCMLWASMLEETGLLPGITTRLGIKQLTLVPQYYEFRGMSPGS